jgi:hypothetical protein
MNCKLTKIPHEHVRQFHIIPDVMTGGMGEICSGAGIKQVLND